MKLLVIVLKKTECLDPLLKRLGEEKILGATVLSSKGMAQDLSQYEEIRFVASLRVLLDPEYPESKTIFMVLPEEQVPLVSGIVKEVAGETEFGMLFTVPVDHAEGLT